MSLALGLDVGTQSTKALLVEIDSGAVVARADSAYGLIEGLPQGAAEQAPETWRAAIRDALAQLAELPGIDLLDVTAVGVSGQQHGCVVLDAEDNPVRPAKLWCDTATAAEAAELSEAFGFAVPTGFTASKLLWLARNEPENWARTTRVLLPHDYVNLLLTGTAAMEVGDASGSGLFDVSQRCFDPRALEQFDALVGDASDRGLAARLPELLDPATPAKKFGVVSAEAAREFGLPVGAIVSPGGGDNMMSAIGSGVTRPGVATVSLGTSGTAFAYSDSPVIDPDGLIAPFCGSAGGWMPLMCVMNLTGLTEEVRTSFGMDHNALTDAAREVSAGCDGLLWLPYLNGERVPDLPHATGTLLGMRPGHLAPGVLYRAALEATSLNLAWGVERLRGLGVQATELRLVGGAARNPLWREILASCLDAPVITLKEHDSAALGAAIQAQWVLSSETGEDASLEELSSRCVLPLGEPQQPVPALRDAYRELSQRFRAEVGRMYPNEL
jgi:xylulokinase